MAGALGKLISAVPSSIKIGSGGTAIPNCKGFDLNTTASIYDAVVDDLAWALNGGELGGKVVTAGVRFLVGGATSSNVLVTGFTPGSALADDLIVVLSGKGSGSPDDATITLLDAVVESVNLGDDGGRGLATISLKAYSADGSTPPYTIAYA